MSTIPYRTVPYLSLQRYNLKRIIEKIGDSKTATPFLYRNDNLSIGVLMTTYRFGLFMFLYRIIDKLSLVFTTVSPVHVVRYRTVQCILQHTYHISLRDFTKQHKISLPFHSLYFAMEDDELFPMPHSVVIPSYAAEGISTSICNNPPTFFQNIYTILVRKF